MNRISVVIVSRNRILQLSDSLQALGEEHQIIVVDNGSTGGVQDLEERFPNVRWIKLPKNFGLTKALNLGLRSAEGEYVLFLHDDTKIPSAGVTELADVLEAHPEIGAAAPLLIDRLGHPTLQVYRNPPDPTLTPATDFDVPAVSGAAIMVRGFFLKAMRQLDERYGNFGSDLDLCAQVHHRANKKVRIVELVRAIHESAPVTSSLITADSSIGTSVYLAKYTSTMAGLKHRVTEAAQAIFTLHWPLAKHLLSNQKIDGTQ